MDERNRPEFPVFTDEDIVHILTYDKAKKIPVEVTEEKEEWEQLSLFDET